MNTLMDTPPPLTINAELGTLLFRWGGRTVRPPKSPSSRFVLGRPGSPVPGRLSRRRSFDWTAAWVWLFVMPCFDARIALARGARIMVSGWPTGPEGGVVGCYISGGTLPRRARCSVVLLTIRPGKVAIQSRVQPPPPSLYIVSINSPFG